MAASVPLCFRFMVFFDDGRAAYVSLPDLHLICSPCKERERHTFSLFLSLFLSHSCLPFLSLHTFLLSLLLYLTVSVSTVKNMYEDIEDPACRTEVREYLEAYPNPIFVVVRVGQESRVERDGEWEDCCITQVDGSLIQICYTVRGWF